jgi:hypothetical protein
LSGVFNQTLFQGYKKGCPISTSGTALFQLEFIS